MKSSVSPRRGHGGNILADGKADDIGQHSRLARLVECQLAVLTLSVLVDRAVDDHAAGLSRSLRASSIACSGVLASPVKAASRKIRLAFYAELTRRLVERDHPVEYYLQATSAILDGLFPRR